MRRLKRIIGPRGLIRPMRPMGPIRLIGLIGVLSLMACSAEQEMPEEPAVPETATAISFSGTESTEEQVTRGGDRAYETYGAYETYKTNKTAGNTRAAQGLEDLLPEDKKYFTVWGYKNMSYSAGSYDDLQEVFPGYTVNWLSNSAATTTTNSSGWEYVAQQTSGDEQTIKYWDWGATAYRFFAVTEGGTYESSGASGAYRTYEVAADASSAAAMEATPYYSRLWFSTGNLADYPTRQFGKPVQLEFMKPFSRVRFMFIYSYAAEGVRLKDPVFKPTDGSKIATKGTVTVSYPLSGSKTKEEYSVTPAATGYAGELTAFTEEYIPEGTEKWYTVLPNTIKRSYTLSVNINGATKTAVVPAEYMTWLPGYSYTYIFKITDLGGVEIDLVQAAVINWSEMEGTHTVYNW